MRLSHQNRPCPCTCADILVLLNHENQHNHDVCQFRLPVLCHSLELDLPTSSPDPSDPAVDASLTQKSTETTVVRLVPNFAIAIDRPSRWSQYFIFRPDSNLSLPIIHQRGWVWSLEGGIWVISLLFSIILHYYSQKLINWFILFSDISKGPHWYDMNLQIII